MSYAARRGSSVQPRTCRMLIKCPHSDLVAVPPYQSSSISPSMSSDRSMPPTCSRILAGSFWLGLSAPRSAASRTAFSISRCEVTPTFLRNFRTLEFNASSFMIVSPSASGAGTLPPRHFPNEGSCRQALHQHVGIRGAERGELLGLADFLRHYGAIAFGVAEAIEETGGLIGQKPYRTALAERRLGLEPSHNRGADAATAQRRQDHQGSQQRVLAMDLQATETNGHRIRGLEAPEQRSERFEVIGRQPRLRERLRQGAALGELERKRE